MREFVDEVYGPIVGQKGRTLGRKLERRPDLPRRYLAARVASLCGSLCIPQRLQTFTHRLVLHLNRAAVRNRLPRLVTCLHQVESSLHGVLFSYEEQSAWCSHQGEDVDVRAV